jgi:hypothetical protein
MDGERKLACSVIAKAIGDFRLVPDMREECYSFLTGKTEISRFWFQCANVIPMEGSISDICMKLKSR